MSGKLPPWSRLVSLLLGIGLGYAAYSSITLEGVLRLINPDWTPIGREYNDGVAIRELFRGTEDPDALVFYIVGGSSAVRSIDADLLAQELSQRLGRHVIARSLTTYRQSIVDTDMFFSMLPPGRRGRSFVIYTWAGIRLQRELAAQVMAALHYQTLALRSDLAEHYRARLRQHSTGFFHRAISVPEDRRCSTEVLESTEGSLLCLMPGVDDDRIRQFLLRPGDDRSVGTRSLLTTVFTGLAWPRAEKNLPAVRRPVTEENKRRAEELYEAQLNDPARPEPDTERMVKALEKIKRFVGDYEFDPEANATLLALSLENVTRRGYQVLLYETPIWQGALGDAGYAQLRERSRAVARLASRISAVPWINQEQVADRPEAHLFLDALHPNLHGKFLASIETAEAISGYLRAHDELIRP